MTITQDDNESRAPEQIAKLVVTGRETDSIEQLTRCVAHLHEVQAAKTQLASLTPAEVLAALEYRRVDLGEAAVRSYAGSTVSSSGRAGGRGRQPRR